MPGRDLILQTKLEPPQVKKQLLWRPRLLNLLKDNTDKRLILICANAGYGKTTLLAQFISGLDCELVYYNLSPGDSDPYNFFNHLISGIRRHKDKFGLRTERILSGSPNLMSDLERILTTFINELMPLRNHIVILDDFHAISGANWVKTAFDYLLTYLPSNTHLIISSREIPNFNLSRLLAHQQIIAITNEELAFTAEEIDQLLKEIQSPNLSPTTLQRLVDISQGWITGIRLILPKSPDDEKIKKSLNGFLASNLPLFEYFANEIFKNEDEKIQQFLSTISILDEIYPKDCDALMRINHSLRILRELERRNIFIMSVGEGKNHFRFHPLFRKYLSYQLQTQGNSGQVGLRYERIGKFFEKSNRIEDAIEYYIRGLKFNRAALLIKDYAESIIAKGQSTTLQDWLSRIPAPIFTRHPWLLFYKAFLLDRLASKLREALNIYRTAAKPFRKDRKGLTRIHLEIATILGRKGAIEEAAIEIKRAERYCPFNDARLRILLYNVKGMIANYTGEYNRVKKYLLVMLHLAKKLNDPAFLVLTHCNLGVFYTEKGNFVEAEKEYEAAIEVIPEASYRRGIGILYANAAYTKIQKGNIDEAQPLLKEGMDISIKYSDAPSLIIVLNILGDLFLEKGDFQQALEYYKQALSLVIEKGEERSRLSIVESIVCLYIKRHDFVQAQEYFSLLVKDSLQPEDICCHPTWAILQAEMQIAQGNNESALKILKKLRPIIEKKALHYLIFKTNLHLAVLYESQGRKFLPFLALAFKDSKKFGYEFCFSKDGRFVDLLKKAAQLMPNDDYLKKIQQQIESKPRVFKLEESFKVRVNFFGVPEVFSDDHLIATKDWVSEKAKKLFCYFVINNQRKITKDELLETFWPDWELVKATNNLSSTIYYIRKALIPETHQRYMKEIILYQGHTYFLDPSLKVETDVHEFEHLVDEIKIKKSIGKILDGDGTLTKAIRLYRGQFGTGWYEPWVENLRTIYENTYSKLLTWAAEEALTQNDFETSFNYSKKLVSIDKFNERAYNILVKSLLGLGKKSEAESYYNQLIEALLEIKSPPTSQSLALREAFLK